MQHFVQSHLSIVKFHDFFFVVFLYRGSKIQSLLLNGYMNLSINLTVTMYNLSEEIRDGIMSIV